MTAPEPVLGFCDPTQCDRTNGPLSNFGAYPEEILGGSGVQRAVENFRLLGQIVGGLDRREHSLDGEERREVGRVRRDDDESEEPPGAADDPPRHRPSQQPATTQLSITCLDSK